MKEQKSDNRIQTGQQSKLTVLVLIMAPTAFVFLLVSIFIVRPEERLGISRVI